MELPKDYILHLEAEGNKREENKMRKPPWKAENARIKRKLAERKEPRKVVHEAVQVPARTVRFDASQYFDEYDVFLMSKEEREEMAKVNIARKVANELVYEGFIKMECGRCNDMEQWRGSVMVVESSLDL